MYVTLSPSPLLIMKEYLILTPLFSNRSLNPDCSPNISPSKSPYSHLLPLAQPRPSACRAFLAPSSPTHTLQHLVGSRCFAAIFTFPVAEGPRGIPAAASPQLGERMCLHRGDHDTKRLSFLSLFSPSFLHLLSQVKENEVQWGFLISTDKFK